MKYLMPMIVLLSGCVATLPDDPTLTADLACETARMVMLLRQEAPPTPASDRCTNCDGTGKIGDGRIVLTCPVCKGTGKP